MNRYLREVQLSKLGTKAVNDFIYSIMLWCMKLVKVTLEKQTSYEYILHSSYIPWYDSYNLRESFQKLKRDTSVRVLTFYYPVS